MNKQESYKTYMILMISSDGNQNNVFFISARYRSPFCQVFGSPLSASLQEDFRMGLLFKFGQAVPEIFKLLHLNKKLGSIFQNSWWGLWGAFENWNGTVKTLFSCFIVELQCKIDISLQPLVRFLKPLILFQILCPIFYKILFLKIKSYIAGTEAW